MLLARWRRSRALKRSASRQFVFCTIATRDFLPWALVLFASLRRTHPAARLLLLYVTAANETPQQPEIEGAQVISVSDLVSPEEEARLRRRFSIPELCFALKPRLLGYALDKLGDRAVYLDSDIDVQAPFDEMAVSLESASVVVTPHLDAPIEMDGKRPAELTILRAGAFNLGFIGVADGMETRQFLHWWSARVMRWGFVAPEFGYQGDQKWLDLAPTLFPGVHVLHDAGYNVAYWNLHSRWVCREDGNLLVKRAGGARAPSTRALVFCHFSGLDPDEPETLSRFQNRFGPADQPEMHGLAADFARRIGEARLLAAQLSWRPLARAEVPKSRPASVASGPLPAEAYRAAISVTALPGSIETGEEASVAVTVQNVSTLPWPVAPSTDGKGGISLSYHLRDAGGNVVAWDNPRVPLLHDFAPGESAEFEVGVKAPRAGGLYWVEFDLVHDGVSWFSERGSQTASMDVHVGGVFPADGGKGAS